MSERGVRQDAWDHEEQQAGQAPVRRLTREEAQALLAKDRSVSPWRVVAVQAAVGVAVAVVFGLATGQGSYAWSALYGAGVVVVPGALMARGMTSRVTSLSPATSAVGFMAWEMVKLGVSVLLLVLANRVVVPLSWPALLVALVVCIKVYWVALWWRRPKKN
jgi:ATP synthase protein I